MAYSRTQRASSGQSLVEALIAMAIFVIMTSAAVGIFAQGQTSTQDAGDVVQAAGIAHNGMEALRAIRDGNWDDLGTGSHGLVFNNGAWQFSGTKDTGGIFTRTASISSIGTDVKKVTVAVTWNSAPVGSHSVQLVGDLTNYANVVNGTGELSGDWSNPRSLSSIDSGPATQGTDVKAEGTVVYLSTDSSNASKADLYVYNITNPSSPTLLASKNIISAKGITALAYATQNGQNYLYALLSGISADLAVINVTNPATPSVTISLNITSANTTSIVFKGDDLYIGTQANDADAELLVYDVSNPASPTRVGSYEIGADVLDLYVYQKRLYVATKKASAGLMILDLTNPASPTLLGTPFAAAVDNVAVKNLANTVIGTGSTIKIIDTTNPASAPVIGTFDLGGTTGDIYAIGYLAFLATSNDLRIINITNPASPFLQSSFNFPQNMAAIDYYNNLLFCAIRSNDSLRIITSSP